MQRPCKWHKVNIIVFIITKFRAHVLYVAIVAYNKWQNTTSLQLQPITSQTL